MPTEQKADLKDEVGEQSQTLQGLVCQAEKLQPDSGDNEEAVMYFNWEITCSDLSAEKVSGCSGEAGRRKMHSGGREMIKA